MSKTDLILREMISTLKDYLKRESDPIKRKEILKELSELKAKYKRERRLLGFKS